MKIWDVELGQEVQTLAPACGVIRALAWHPDGQRLAAAADTQSALVFDARPLTDSVRCENRAVLER